MLPIWRVKWYLDFSLVVFYISGELYICLALQPMQLRGNLKAGTLRQRHGQGYVVFIVWLLSNKCCFTWASTRQPYLIRLFWNLKRCSSPFSCLSVEGFITDSNMGCSKSHHVLSILVFSLHVKADRNLYH